MSEVMVEGDARGFVEDIVVRGHNLKADEPRDLGGTDLGPTPTEIMLASLGACTSMTVAMYARRKRWPLERVRVVLHHEKDVHATPNDRVTRIVTFEGALDAAQRERLLEMANKCPIHRLLEGGVAISTSLEPAKE